MIALWGLGTVIDKPVSRTDFHGTEYGWHPEDQGQTSTNPHAGQPPISPLFLSSSGVFHSPDVAQLEMDIEIEWA